MSVAILFSNKMVGRNINVEKNDKGWYKVKLGELNAYNSHGELYLENDVKQLLLERDSYLSVANRLESGLLKGEATHPIREGHSDSDWLTRHLIINELLASHTFMEISLETTKEYTNGKPVVGIWGWILPTGNEHGRSLKADLDNPDVNVAFSIRCFSKVVSVNGTVGRYITKIVTWDRIDIPGLKNAVKGGDIGNITAEGALKDVYISSETLSNILSNKNLLTTENAGLYDDLLEMKNEIDGKPSASLFHNW